MTRLPPTRFIAAGAMAALLSSTASAGDAPSGRIIFARGQSLWITDTHGKTPAVELAVLPGPASDVRIIRSDATGAKLLLDYGGRWYAATTPPANSLAILTELPCAASPARLSPTGVHVLCADPSGHAQLVRMRDRAVFPRNANALSGATVIERDYGRELVSIADGAVVSASLRRQDQRRLVAPMAPVRGFLAAPDGSRGVGIFHEAPAHPAGAPARDQLMAFPLDGSGARRHLIRNGVAIDWSWNGAWLLLQDGGKACIARGVGGQYKCWNGFTAMSISPDGAFALLLGPRTVEATVAAPAPTDEDAEPDGGGDDAVEADANAVALPKGPLSLYRARIAGTYTEPPVLVETVVDGAALWLPVPATTPQP